MTDIIKLYNPANAAALTSEQIEGLRKLTSEQIKELAKAYPNGTSNYLLIIDGTSKNKNQLPTLSTFQNLWNLREKNGLRNFVAYGFRGSYKAKPVLMNGKPKKSEVLDLSDTELMTLPGFKIKGEPKVETDVKVIKVKKTKIQ